MWILSYIFFISNVIKNKWCQIEVRESNSSWVYRKIYTPRWWTLQNVSIIYVGEFGSHFSIKLNERTYIKYTQLVLEHLINISIQIIRCKVNTMSCTEVYTEASIATTQARHYQTRYTSLRESWLTPAVTILCVINLTSFREYSHFNLQMNRGQGRISSC